MFKAVFSKTFEIAAFYRLQKKIVYDRNATTSVFSTESVRCLKPSEL